jgi:hypothetical protein
VVGAVIGLAALAAIAANRQKAEATEIASWAVGEFTGQDPREQMQVQLRILPGGQVSGRAGEHDIIGHLQGMHLEASRQRFLIEQQGNGFLAVDELDGTHRVVFNRVATGY